MATLLPPTRRTLRSRRVDASDGIKHGAAGLSISTQGVIDVVPTFHAGPIAREEDEHFVVVEIAAEGVGLHLGHGVQAVAFPAGALARRAVLRGVGVEGELGEELAGFDS